MGWVSGPLSIFVFVPAFLALWWPKIDRKSGFPQLFAKTVGSIHFIPGIYTYGVSLWTPIDFRVRALIFGPLVAKNWPKIGVSASFRKNCRLHSFHPWDLYLWGKSLDPYRFSCSCPHFWPSGGQKLTENRGFRNFSRKLFLRFPNFLYQLQPRYLSYHDTLVGRVMPKFFSNKFFLNDSHQCSYHNDLKIGLFVGYFLMGWVLIRAGVYCPHLWAQLVKSGLNKYFGWQNTLFGWLTKLEIVCSENFMCSMTMIKFESLGVCKAKRIFCNYFFYKMVYMSLFLMRDFSFKMGSLVVHWYEQYYTVLHNVWQFKRQSIDCSCLCRHNLGCFHWGGCWPNNKRITF